MHHAPSGCAVTAMQVSNAKDQLADALGLDNSHSAYVCTDMNDSDIVFGATDNLKEVIRETYRQYQYGIEAEVMFSIDGFEIHNDIRNNDYFGPPLIIGSIFEKKLAEELNGNFLAVSAPIKERLILSSSYVGYHGGLRLLEDIYTYVLKQFN